MTYLLGFLFYIHAYLLIYINSSFLAQFTSARTVGLIFTIGNLAAMLGFIAAPRMLEYLGNFRTTLIVIILEFVAVGGLATFESLAYIIPLFVGHSVMVRMLGFSADVFLESGSDDRHTGNIRGVFLTITNIALVLSPLAVGIVLGDTTNYWRIYTISSLILAVPLLLLLLQFRKYKDPVYVRVPFAATFKEILRRKNVLRILLSNLTLRLFYAWMVIYTPIYLHQTIGFSWDKIGIIFTVMLLPYVLFELPLGRLADSKWGEKEILSVGFVILAISTSALSFISSSNFWVWAVALFITRIGASLVEIMNETYFFKKVDATDSNIIGFFRMVQPAAYVVAPLVASVALLFLEIRYVFVVLGLLLLTGLIYSTKLKDTR